MHSARDAIPSSDESLCEDVVAELADDAGFEARRIQVSVHNGTVSLEGQVVSVVARARAERTVSLLRGVTAVRNALVVDAGDLHDAEDFGEEFGPRETEFATEEATEAAISVRWPLVP